MFLKVLHDIQNGDEGGRINHKRLEAKDNARKKFNKRTFKKSKLEFKHYRHKKYIRNY